MASVAGSPVRPHSVSPKWTSLAVAIVASSRPRGCTSVRTRAGSQRPGATPSTASGYSVSASRPLTCAVWCGPVVVTSASPTRVHTSAPGSVVNVTTTSSAPTLMSWAWATAIVRRGCDDRCDRTIATARAGAPRGASATAPRAPTRAGCRRDRRPRAQRWWRRSRPGSPRPLPGWPRARSTAASQRHVPVLARRHLLALGAQHRQRSGQHPARLPGIDDVVDVAALGRDVRVGEPLLVLGDQLGAPGLDAGGGVERLAVDEVAPAGGAHDGDLRRRPREREVGTDRLRVHHHVRAAVRLAGDDLHARHGRLAVRVEQLRPVPDDPPVLLIGAGEEPGH